MGFESTLQDSMGSGVHTPFMASHISLNAAFLALMASASSSGGSSPSWASLYSSSRKSSSHGIAATTAGGPKASAKAATSAAVFGYLSRTTREELFCIITFFSAAQNASGSLVSAPTLSTVIGAPAPYSAANAAATFGVTSVDGPLTAIWGMVDISIMLERSSFLGVAETSKRSSLPSL